MKNWRGFLSFSMGVLVLGLMGWGIYEGISSLVKKLQPEEPGDTSIALSAGFVLDSSATAAVSADEAAAPPAGNQSSGGEAADPVKAAEQPETEKPKEAQQEPPKVFEIRGSVQRDGRPVASGKVRLTVSLVGERFRQSALTNLKNGEFDVHNHPAFQILQPKNRIRVLAEVWPASRTGAGNAEPLSETIYLNHHLPSWIRNSTGYGVLAGVLLFVMLFLWSFTGRSTYGKNRLAIILSYSVIFLSLAGALVGPTLLMLAVPDLPEISGRVPVGLVVAKLTENSKPEWMLNLGGYVGEGERRAANGQPAGPETVATVKDEGIGAPVLRVMTLNGGIQIPLYVILLALIGGAINMTRKVPEFQSLQPDQGSFWHQMGWGQQSDDKSNPKDDDGKHETKDEHAWRKGLLDQYMFLIAAPFLAIATYYLLILLGTIQPPIIVLVCFSIGLISDRVVTAITKAAEKVLGGKDDKPGEPGGEQPDGDSGSASAPVAPLHAPKQVEEEKRAA